MNETITDEQPFVRIFETASTSSNDFSIRNYFRGCKWSPDGSCILTATNDNISRIYNLPNRYLQTTTTTTNNEPNMTPLPEMLTPAVQVKNSDLIYDFVWYPKMSSIDPTTSVFLVSCGRCPLRLIDAYDGSTRATYKSFIGERLISPHSICFSPDGSLIIGGSHASIWLYDVESPGNYGEQIFTYQDDIRQAGIITSVTFNSNERNIFATGSYSGSIALWDLNSFEMTSLFDVSKKGVTHMIFNSDGKYLFSASRCDDNITIWDLRERKKLAMLKRDSNTNQRMYFDINQHLLVGGNCNGNISIWNIKDNLFNNDQSIHFEGHQDCVNGVSFHPTLPIVSSCSGSRKFPSLLSSNDEEDSEDDQFFSNEVPKVDNSLRMWDM